MNPFSATAPLSHLVFLLLGGALSHFPPPTRDDIILHYMIGTERWPIETSILSLNGMTPSVIIGMYRMDFMVFLIIE